MRICDKRREDELLGNTAAGRAERPRGDKSKSLKSLVPRDSSWAEYSRTLEAEFETALSDMRAAAEQREKTAKAESAKANAKAAGFAPVNT